MAVIYEVTVKAGTYQKDGQEKVRYQRIGSVIETKKGMMMKMDSMPLVDGGWNGWSYLFTPRDAAPSIPSKKSDNDFQDDSIPF